MTKGTDTAHLAELMMNDVLVELIICQHILTGQQGKLILRNKRQPPTYF